MSLSCRIVLDVGSRPNGDLMMLIIETLIWDTFIHASRFAQEAVVRLLMPVSSQACGIFSFCVFIHFKTEHSGTCQLIINLLSPSCSVKLSMNSPLSCLFKAMPPFSGRRDVYRLEIHIIPWFPLSPVPQCANSIQAHRANISSFSLFVHFSLWETIRGQK